MRWLGKLFKLFIPLLSAILALLVANKYNFFATLRFVPEQSAYEICITVYFAISDLIVSSLIKFLQSKMENFWSRVEVLISIPHTEASLQTPPTILFNSEGTAEMQVNVHLKGKKKHYKGTKIIICDTGYITLQPSTRARGVSIAENGDYTIDLYAITGNGTTIDVKQTFRIVMEENVPDGSRTMTLEPGITKHNLWLKFSRNHAIIKVEER